MSEFTDWIDKVFPMAFPKASERSEPLTPGAKPESWEEFAKKHCLFDDEMNVWFGKTPATPDVPTTQTEPKVSWDEIKGDSDPVNHPAHYGGEDNPYEAIKVIEAWQLGFCLGNTVKYISRAGKKGDALTDLRKAYWYLWREIERLEALR